MKHREHVRHPAPAWRCLVRPATRWRNIQVQHRYGEHPVVKRNYSLRSHLRGLVFTLNHIAVTEDSAIVCVHDSDQHHENDHWRRRRRRRRPHPRRWGWGRPRRRWRWRPLRPKTAFPLRLRPFGPHGGIVGRPARAALIPRRYRRLKRATSHPLAGFARACTRPDVAREASSGNLLRTNSAVTRFPVKSPPCAATITTPIPNLASHVSFNDGLLAADYQGS